MFLFHVFHPFLFLVGCGLVSRGLFYSSRTFDASGGFQGWKEKYLSIARTHLGVMPWRDASGGSAWLKGGWRFTCLSASILVMVEAPTGIIAERE